MERSTAQSLQESAALHSMLDGTREAITRLHQLYSDGFAAIKDQIASIMQTQAQSNPSIDYSASLRSHTSQLSSIVSELDEIKQNIEKGTKTTQKERGKDVAKFDEVLSLLSTIEGKFDGVEQSVANTTAALTKTLMPEHKKLAKEMNTRFDDVTSSIQEIVEEVMKPLSDSVYKALRQKDEESRPSVAHERPFGTVDDSTTDGPVHSSVTIDTLFEDKIERINRSITTESTQSTVQRKDKLEDWFATFIQRRSGSQTASIAPIASSQLLEGSQVSTHDSWFEEVEMMDFVTPSQAPSQAFSQAPSQVQPTPAAAETPSSPPKRKSKPSFREVINLGQSQEEGTYWDISDLEPRKRNLPTKYFPSLFKRPSASYSSAKGRRAKSPGTRYPLRSSAKATRIIEESIAPSKASEGKEVTPSSIKAQRQRTRRARKSP